MYLEEECSENVRETLIVTEALTRDKFEDIMSNFHLTDNYSLQQEDNLIRNPQLTLTK